MNDTDTAIAALQAQLAALRPAVPAVAPGVSGWQQQAPPPGPAHITGVSVPVKIPYGRGNIKCLFHLPPEVASSPQALTDALDALAAAGLPLDTWEPSDRQGGSGWSSNRGGYNNNSGGWRR
jgi:hypothetical protein